MKKKLKDWENEIKPEEFKILTEKLTKEGKTEEEYELDELKTLLISDKQGWGEWLKVKGTWARENWIAIIVGVVVIGFLVWFLKWIYKNVFGD